MAGHAEEVYRTYQVVLGSLPKYRTQHPKLQMLLYRDREEMRWINPGMGWAEAFYRKAGWQEVGAYGKGEIKFEMSKAAWQKHRP